VTAGGGFVAGVVVAGVVALDENAAGVVALDANGVAALDANGLRTPSAKVSMRLATKRLVRERPRKPPLAAAWAHRLLEILRSDMLTLSAAQPAAIAVAIVSDHAAEA
jgi:hypothetical protein